ncbi:acetyl-CoA carboxylase [Tenacibaculum xiamenense]|uniref:acetyl-CoA carboxylase n=1 Tax=Tenacibaculum xiamenense TaxID=1261553 RepID=UPI00389343C6
MKTITEIIAPLPGIFYKKPSPESDDFKKEGDEVKVGDTLFLIEVMKTFNSIESEIAGKLVKYTVENEEPVNVGQVIAIIESES